MGLFGLCMLVACGLWGIVAAMVRPEVTVAGAAITGCVFFVVIYGCGWVLFST